MHLSSMQDDLMKCHGQKSLKETTEAAVKLLSEGANQLKESQYSLQHLQGIAKVRFAAWVVAELIYKQNFKPVHPALQGGQYYFGEAQQLIQDMKDCYENWDEDSEETHSSLYLVKLLSRKNGVSFITDVMETNRAWLWIIPEYLQNVGCKRVPLC